MVSCLQKWYFKAQSEAHTSDPKVIGNLIILPSKILFGHQYIPECIVTHIIVLEKHSIYFNTV